MSRCRSVVLITAVLASLCVGTSHAGAGGRPPGSETAVQCGVVRSGDTPVGAADVTLYQAGDQPGAPATPLARTRSDDDGAFSLSYRRPSDPAAVLYLVADAAPRGGERASGRHSEQVRLAAVLGAPRPWPQVVVNERTTVAAAYAMAQFTDGAAISGSSPGLQNAAAISHNLADITNGEVAPLLSAAPNGPRTSTLRAFQSLANILAGCVDGLTCDSLFALAQPPGKPEPQDTLQAAVDIARAPGNHVGDLFDLSTARPLYEPSLSAAPDAWTLALRYDGNGHELDGPGNIAFDADGNAWVTNNYRFDADPRASVCGGRSLLKFTPTGQDAPGAPYGGGGLYGAGFGITVDPRGDVWAGNFGFQGSKCSVDASRFNRSISQFGADGAAKSPAEGWRSPKLVQPQGTASDRNGNIWIADCGSRSVTVFPGGRPDRARSITLPDDTLVKPFGATVDPAGQVWVTGNGSDSVVSLSPDGRPTRTVTGAGIKNPLGIASDSLGNVWVANSGVLPVPCEDSTPADLADASQDLPPRDAGASVTMIRPDGTTPEEPFTNDGMVLPWGVAVDGDDTVWVANFGGHRLARLCGARLSACPPGYTTGQPISPPDTGYTSDGLDRNTGIRIDPSGNVWLVNNWRTVPLQTNPGGHELVVFVGLAAPVSAPLIGAPRRP